MRVEVEVGSRQINYLRFSSEDCVCFATRQMVLNVPHTNPTKDTRRQRKILCPFVLSSPNRAKIEEVANNGKLQSTRCHYHLLSSPQPWRAAPMAAQSGHNSQESFTVTSGHILD